MKNYSYVVSQNSEDSTVDIKNISNQQFCFLSLSPHKSYTNTSQLTVIINWILKYFKKVLIVEGTYNSRWNYYSSKENTEREIANIVDNKINKFNRKINNISKYNNLENRLEILNWKKMISKKRYRSIHSYLFRFYEINLDFKNCILNEIEKFFESRNSESKNISTENSITFIIEEVAMVLYLYQLGYHTEVYPGSDLLLLKNIKKGMYQSFPFDMGGRNHLSIKVEKNI